MNAPIPLASLRPRPTDVAELTWYWDGSRESALGLRSSWEALCARAQGASGGQDPESWAEDRRVEASMRARAIEARLHQLSRAHQRALRALYVPSRLLAPWLGRNAPLALLLPAGRKLGRRALEGLALRMATGKADQEQQRSAQAIRQAADVLALEAHQAYAGASK